MSDGPLQFTMRELQRLSTAPRFWAVIVAVSVLLGLVGPFGTYDGLRLPARLAYWTATVIATWHVGFGVVAFLSKLWPGGRPGSVAPYLLFGAVAGLPVTLVVWALNAAAFEGEAIAFLPLLAYTVAISAVVSAVVALFVPQQARATATPMPAAPEQPKRPPILDRLPPHLRGNLAYMTMQDHYVDVHTDKGSTLILMRFADAIAEAEPVEGLRIHRSHWVATAEVAQSVRVGGRLMLKVKDGALLPVSRSYVEAVRSAGLA